MNGTEELIIAIEQAEKVAYNQFSTSEQFKNEITTLTAQMKTFKEANKTTTVELEKTISEAKQVQFNDPKLNNLLAKVIADAEVIVKEVGEADETNLGPNQLQIDFTNKQLKYLMLNLPAMDQVIDIILKNDKIIAKKGQFFTIEITNNDLLWDKEYKITKGVDLVQEFYFSQNLGEIQFYAKEAGEVQIELSALNAKNKTIVDVLIKEEVPLKEEKFQFQEILYSDFTQQWEKSNLQEQIKKSNLINKNDIDIEIDKNITTTNLEKGATVYSQNINFINKTNNSDQFLLTHYWYKTTNETPSEMTIYIDSDGNVKTTNNFDSAIDANAKIILKIGFNSKGETIKNFLGEVLPSELPSEIKILSSFFTKNPNEDIVGIKNWNTKNVTDISALFSKTPFLNPDIRNWDTSNVTNMQQSFFKAISFNQDLSKWGTSKVTNMNETFRRTEKFDSNITTWVTSSVVDMTSIFYETKVFNQDISNWDTSNVTTMENLVRSAEKFNQDLSGWNVDKVTNWENFAYNVPTSQWAESKRPHFKR